MPNETLDQFSAKALTLIPNSIYEHYKGMRYQIIGIARHSETLEELVIYKALYGAEELWVRPVSMFTENVNINGKEILRFRLVK